MRTGARHARGAARERARLVTELREREAIRSDAVGDAFAAVPRELFIPELLAREGVAAVYRDEAFVTKRHPQGAPVSSSSQPAMMAEMLELLEVRPGDRVLEVGAGTGYNAAVLRHLVGRGGRVTTIDVDAEVARGARAALRQAGCRASVVVGEGRAGWPAQAPYDRIIVTACAEQLPAAWLDQLQPGGRLITPLRLDPDGAAIQLIPVFERDGDRLRSAGMTWAGFMALHGGGDGGGWRPPPDSVSASRSARGAPTVLASITGPGLRGLGEATARRLLAALAAGDGERRARGVTAMGTGRTPLLLVYLLLAISDRRRVSVTSHGFGGGTGGMAARRLRRRRPGRGRARGADRGLARARDGRTGAARAAGLAPGWGPGPADPLWLGLNALGGSFHQVRAWVTRYQCTPRVAWAKARRSAWWRRSGSLPLSGNSW